MRTTFAPMGQQTVRFAKQYEGEPMRATRRRRHGGGHRLRLAWAASLGRVASTRPARPAVTEPLPSLTPDSS